jgi:Tfp pilus assembly protein PilO
MGQFIFPIILVGLSVASFLVFTNPTYKEIAGYRAQATAYNEALTNAKELQQVRDQLAEKYNAMPAEDIERLEKLLPNNVDNIRLIIEIERIASTYGMVIKNVKYDVSTTAAASSNPVMTDGVEQQVLDQNRDFGTFSLSFSTEGNYDRFLTFLSDLERSLRIVDVKSIAFSSTESGKTGDTTSYKYDIEINTYWLRN